MLIRVKLKKKDNMDLFHRIALEEYILAMQENKHGDSAYVKDVVFTRFEVANKMIKKEVTIGDCRLILGDCMEVMPLLGKVDAVVTDPPYGIGMHKQIGKKKGEKNDKWNAPDFDNAPATPESINMMRDISENQIIWGGNYFDLPATRCFLIWDKVQRVSFADCEYAWTNLDTSARVFTFARSNMQGFRFPERSHPTQKPVELMKWCIEKVEGVILDCYMGSGTTGVACAKMGRKFIGIELDEGYFEIACKRVQEAYNSPDMLIQLEKQPATQEKLI